MQARTLPLSVSRISPPNCRPFGRILAFQNVHQRLFRSPTDESLRPTNRLDQRIRPIMSPGIPICPAISFNRYFAKIFVWADTSSVYSPSIQRSTPGLVSPMKSESRVVMRCGSRTASKCGLETPRSTKPLVVRSATHSSVGIAMAIDHESAISAEPESGTQMVICCQ